MKVILCESSRNAWRVILNSMFGQGNQFLFKFPNFVYSVYLKIQKMKIYITIKAHSRV